MLSLSVEWSLNARPPTVRYRVSDPGPYGKIVYGRRDVRDQVTGDWPPIPHIDLAPVIIRHVQHSG
jgi:hypothetical protein